MRQVSVTVTYEVMGDIPLREIYDDLADHRGDLPDNLVEFEAWLDDRPDVLEDYLTDRIDPYAVELQDVATGFIGDFDPDDYSPDYWTYHHPLQLAWDLAG